jgi:hypothetical protein
MLHYYSDYQTLCFFRKSSLFEQKWKDSSVILNADTFMKEMYILFDYIEIFKPKKVLINLENLRYNLPQKYEEDLRDEILRLNEIGVEKVAIVNNSERAALPALMENIHHISFIKPEFELFSNPENALEWLQRNKTYADNHFEKKFRIAG